MRSAPTNPAFHPLIAVEVAEEDEVEAQLQPLLLPPTQLHLDLEVTACTEAGTDREGVAPTDRTYPVFLLLWRIYGEIGIRFYSTNCNKILSLKIDVTGGLI